MKSEDIVKRLNEIKDIPTLPVIAMEVNRMLESDNTSIETLSNAIVKDQAIASKVLRLVNSSFFSMRSKVTSIRDAVVLLGCDSIRNIVVSISLVKAFSGVLSQKGFTIDQFWRHSVSVAMTSKKISEIAGLEDPECSFTAGLFHDIGKVILSQYFPMFFETIVVKSMNEKISFQAAEKCLTLFGHDKAGAFLAGKWKLPIHLVDVIRFHHTLSPRASNLNLVKIVHSANTISEVLSLSKDTMDDSAAEAIAEKIDQRVFQDPLLSPHLKSAAFWYPELSDNIKEACLFFTKGN
jgi:putative nucleotidyltransferase with HDIG domain